jgi:alpha-tubulin suppressor-like RCC1 family protein
MNFSRCASALGIAALLLSMRPAVSTAQQTQSSPPIDTQAIIQAIISTPAQPASEAPKYGTFYSAQFGDKWPPLPADTLGLDFWDLGSGFYLLCDTNVNYDALQQESQNQSSPATPMTGFSMMASSLLNSSYAYANPVYLTNMAATAGASAAVASFSISGGTNFVPFDILMTTNVAARVSNWTWIGIGYTSNRYTFQSQPLAQAFYILARPSKTMVVGWGGDGAGQCDVPYGLTNALMVAGGGGQSLALLTNGTVVAWGQNADGQGSVPTNLAGVTMVSCGWYHDLALLTNGTITAWGLDGASLGWHLTEVPTNLTNVTVISAQALHSLALTSNGTVVAWGYGPNGEASVPSGLSNVVAISAGYQFNLAALSNGTVTAWGDNTYGQCNVPAGLSHVVDVEAGPFHSLALLNNGTVVAWGDGSDGETNVPAGLTNVVAIAAGGDPNGDDTAYSLALKRDGTVVSWGEGPPVGIVQGMSNVFAIAAGADHALAIRTGPPTPVITLSPINEYQLPGGNVTFTARGISLYGVTYQWQFNGVNIAGATNTALTLSNVGTNQEGNYSIVVTSSNGSITSSNVFFAFVQPPVITSQTLPMQQLPVNGSNCTLTVSASSPSQSQFPIGYKWQLNGTNLAGVTNSTYTFVATTNNQGVYSVSVTNAAGGTNAFWHVNVVLVPGSVWGVGNDFYGQTDFPIGLTNAIGLAAGLYHAMALREDGTVIAWGDNLAGETNVPAGLSNVVGIAAGDSYSLALKADGTLSAWGADESGQVSTAPTISGVKAISVSDTFSLALKQNGTMVAWGGDIYGQTNVPAGLTNVTAVSAGSEFGLALLQGGTVAAWGDNYYGETNIPPGLSNVVAISAGAAHSLALRADGTVVAWGLNYWGQTNVPAGLSNVMAIAAGYFHSVALKNDGTVVAWGNNDFGGRALPTNLPPVKLIAASLDYSLVGLSSSLLQYPVDVTKDLLLIYNTNSTDSSNVCAYYLQHRPLVSGANVLGIGFSGFYIASGGAPPNSIAVTNITDYETISPPDFTNIIQNPVLGWLNSNPTKRPQYVILFLGVPSRVNDTATSATNFPFYPSGDQSAGVDCQLQTMMPGWQPFIMHINMGDSNDCKAYIDKLAYFGTNGPAVSLLISGTAGRYTNTNYYIDDSGSSGLSNTVTALIQSGVVAASIDYAPPTATHIYVGTNVAGYLSHGSHGSAPHLPGTYATDGTITFEGDSDWYIIQTIESFNGQAYESGQGNYIGWFSANAFGGTNYGNTPLGAISTVDEPGGLGTGSAPTYFTLWAAGKNFGICAWNARTTPYYFQAVGDPLTTK